MFASECGLCWLVRSLPVGNDKLFPMVGWLEIDGVLFPSVFEYF